MNYTKGSDTAKRERGNKSWKRREMNGLKIKKERTGMKGREEGKDRGKRLLEKLKKKMEKEGN